MKSYREINPCRFILALDPSGSFYEGKGTTGYCVFDTKTNTIIECGSLYAKHYTAMEQYWDAVLDLILWQHKHRNIIVICEDYLLYANKLHDQINSRMETPKLIGCIQLCCYKNIIPYYMQTAAEVKKRWADHILLHKGYIKPGSRKGSYVPATGMQDSYSHHSLDAIRHAVHYATFKNK